MRWELNDEERQDALLVGDMQQDTFMSASQFLVVGLEYEDQQ